MQEYAEFQDEVFFRVVEADERPADIPHKSTFFLPLTRVPSPETIALRVASVEIIADLDEDEAIEVYQTEERPYDEARRLAYDAEGCGVAELTVALVEAAEDPPRPQALEDLQAKRAAIKLRYPKPS